MSGTDLTFIVAIAAGLLSFLSPCVLPLVPAYVGQLTRVAVRSAAASPAGAATATGPSRWVALRHALAYVGGFGLVFTLLGVTATFAGGALGAYLPALRRIGGAVLILMGLNLAGILTIARLQRTWQPLLAGGASSLATSGGGSVIGRTFGPDGAPRSSVGDRLGARLTGSSNAWLASFGLGVIFAIGWTPCIGTILGGILLRPLVRHGRVVSLIGGLLVAAIGLAMLFDLLILIPRYFTFLTAI
jgi:cytochrome c-type biogenesis protein